MSSKSMLLVAAACLSTPGLAHAEDKVPQNTRQDAEPGVLRISTGINYSEGDYGYIQKTKVIAAPIGIKYTKGGFSIRLSVPFIHVEGPGSLIDSPAFPDASAAADDRGGST